MDCRLIGKCKNDLIMLNSVFLAMEKARDKFKSTQGVIGRLIEISRFYELAVMQLDGCLRILEGEMDTFKVNHEEMLSDLYLVRDRLQRRLDDTELTIINTDAFLAQRCNSELKLNETIEIKEKEVNWVQGDFDQLEISKRKGYQKAQKYQSNSASRVTNGKAVDRCLFNDSLDVTFKNFNQMFDSESSQIDELVSDIDRIKESMDVAFAKMHKAFISSEIDQAEYEWLWSIEKDVMIIAVNGLTDDFHDIHELTVRKLNYFSPLMSEFRSLRTELEQLTCEKDTSVYPSSIQTDTRVRIPTGTKERLPVEKNKGKKDDYDEAEQAIHSKDESGNYVAKLISTHEKIIQKKVEEQRANEKLIRERWYLAMRKDKQSDGLNKKIQDVIARLDGIIKLSPPSENISLSFLEDGIKPMQLRRFSSESEIDFRSFSSSMFCQVDEDVFGQIRIMELEEDLRLQSLIMEQVLGIFMTDWVNQCYDEFDTRNEQLFIKARILEQDAEKSKTMYKMLEDVCRRYEKENEKLYRQIKVMGQENEELEKQFSVLEDVYIVLLTNVTKELFEELQKLNASKDLLEEIVYEFTKML